MGDAGEGLIDAESRIQERLEDLARQREESRVTVVGDPEAVRALETLELARAELNRQIQETAHERRRAQLSAALAEVDRRIEHARRALNDRT